VPRKKNFVQIYDRKWYKAGEPYIHICCDCGLSHDVTYKMEDGQLFYKWNRNKKRTQEERESGKYDAKVHK